MGKSHTCEGIVKLNESRDSFVQIVAIDEKWIFRYVLFADCKCVEDEQAQYAGEVMFVYDLLVNHCPYCGIELTKDAARPYSSSHIVGEGTRHQCVPLEEYNNKYPYVGFSFDTDAQWMVVQDLEGLWFLERHTVATRRMVLAGEADEGELLLWCGTVVSFCPFCGVLLADLLATNKVVS